MSIKYSYNKKIKLNNKFNKIYKSILSNLQNEASAVNPDEFTSACNKLNNVKAEDLIPSTDDIDIS